MFEIPEMEKEMSLCSGVCGEGWHREMREVRETGNKRLINKINSVNGNQYKENKRELWNRKLGGL